MSTITCQKLALIPEAALLTFNGVEQTPEITGAYNAIAGALNTEAKPQDFIRSDWIRVMPANILADMAVSRLRAGLPVPSILAKAIAGDKESKKALVIARKDRKAYLVKNQRTVVASLIDSGYQIAKLDTTKAQRADKRGNLHVDLRFTKGAKANVTEEDKKAVISSLSLKELQALLAAKEEELTAPMETTVTEVPASSPEVPVTE